MGLYHANKDAKVGSIIECPVCHKPFKKIQYSQAFCSGECKDRFWNANRGVVKPHKKKGAEVMSGWVARDKSGHLRLWRTRPSKETNFDFGECWGLPCEMGAWLRLDNSMFPSVKWEDDEPTPAEIIVKLK